MVIGFSKASVAGTIARPLLSIELPVVATSSVRQVLLTTHDNTDPYNFCLPAASCTAMAAL